MNQSAVPSLLHDLLRHAERTGDIYVKCGGRKSFENDATAQDAILWNLVVIGEISVRLGESFHGAHPEIPWRSVIAQRNVIAHGYDVLDWSRLIAVVENDIPGLGRHVRVLLDSFGPPPDSSQ